MGFNSFPCNPYPISTEELNKGNNDALNTRVTALEEGVTGLGNRVTTLEGDVTNLNSNKANQITIAPFFNAETAYEVGDLVYYNGLSYRCTNAHQGEWDADDFAATTIANELSSLESGLTNVAEVTDTTTAYGDFTVPQSIDISKIDNIWVVSPATAFAVATAGGFKICQLAISGSGISVNLLASESATVKIAYSN